MEGFGFFGARAVWWSPMPFFPNRELPLYAGGEPITDLEWIDFILLDLGITMWRNEIYPFVPVYSTTATNSQDSNWAVQKHFVKALNDRAVELGIDLRIILTVWSPPGEWKYNQHTRAYVGPMSPPPPPDGMAMREWNRLMPDHYVDFAHWLVSALEMYREIGVEVYAISPQNEPYFNQSFNSSFYTAAEFTQMLNVVAPIIYEYFPNVYVFGAEAMLGHEHSNAIYGWNNLNMHFHRRILEGATPEAMRNFVFAHHGYYDGVYAQALEHHAILWAAEREMLNTHGQNSRDGHRLWMTETSGYSNEWLEDNPNRPGSLALAMAIQSALIYGDVSAWVWWQGSDIATGPHGAYYELMRPGVNLNKVAASQHFYRYIRPGAVRIDAQLNEPSRNLMASAFVHEELDNTVIVLVNNGEDIYELEIQGADGATFSSVITLGSPFYLLQGHYVSDGGSIHIPPHSVVTLVHGSYVEHGTPDNPAFSQAEMDARDVGLALYALELAYARGNNFVMTSSMARDVERSITVVNRMITPYAFYLDREVIPVEYIPAVDATHFSDGQEGEFQFMVRVQQGDAYAVTELMTLRLTYGMDYMAQPPIEELMHDEHDEKQDEQQEDEQKEPHDSGRPSVPQIIFGILGLVILVGLVIIVKRK